MKLQIADEMYDLEYTVNAICDLEELSGKSLGEVLSSGQYSSVRSLLWCGLITKQPQTTVEKAGEILQAYLQTKTTNDFILQVGMALDQAGFLRAQGKAKTKK